jgi:large subunit ribosomal protein L14e
LVEGPSTGVARQALPTKRISLTKFKLNIRRNTSTKRLTAAIKTAELHKQWDATSTAKKLAIKAKRASLNDFDRFKAMVFRRRVIIIMSKC